MSRFHTFERGRAFLGSLGDDQLMARNVGGYYFSDGVRSLSRIEDAFSHDERLDRLVFNQTPIRSNGGIFFAGKDVNGDDEP